MKKLILSALGLCLALGSLHAQFYVIESTGELDGYAWDATGTTIIASSADDVYSSVQTLPFTFDFYGQSVTQYLISDNGYITFDIADSVSTGANTSIPNAGGPNNAIYAAWDDLALIGVGTPDVVKSYTMGTSPNRTHVIQWHSVNQVAAGGSAYLYAAILIHESGDFDVVIPWAQGTMGSFTIGCENAAGTDGIEVSGSPNYSLPSSGSDPVDDLVFNFYAGTQPAVDPKLVTAVIPKFASADGSAEITGVVQNLGANSLSSFDIEWTDGTDTYSHTINNTLASGATYAFTHPDQVMLAGGTSATIEVTVVAANDANMDNNTVSGDVDGVGFIPEKVVVGEEATGTWCGWCPRGMVGLAYMEENYEESWIGIAVHNNDPMENSAYDTWMGSQISGYPSGLVDRVEDIDPNWASLEAAYNVSMQSFGVANIEVWPLYIDEDEVELRVKFHFAVDYDDDLRVAVIIVEDGLTGTGSDWNQVNYYSGGNYGLLSGAGFDWHNEPGSVSGVTYDDVGREALTDVEGDADILAATYSEDEEVEYVWDRFTWDTDYVPENSRIVVMLIDDSNDEVINAGESHLLETTITVDSETGATIYTIEGTDYEVFEGDKLVPLGMAAAPKVEFDVYPNPAIDVINVRLNEAADVMLVDLMGKVVATAGYSGVGTGVQFNTEMLSAGIYNVVVTTEASTSTERITVVK